MLTFLLVISVIVALVNRMPTGSYWGTHSITGRAKIS